MGCCGRGWYLCGGGRRGSASAMGVVVGSPLGTFFTVGLGFGCSEVAVSRGRRSGSASSLGVMVGSSSGISSTVGRGVRFLMIEIWGVLVVGIWGDGILAPLRRSAMNCRVRLRQLISGLSSLSQGSPNTIFAEGSRRVIKKDHSCVVPSSKVMVSASSCVRLPADVGSPSKRCSGILCGSLRRR